MQHNNLEINRYNSVNIIKTKSQKPTAANNFINFSNLLIMFVCGCIRPKLEVILVSLNYV